MPLYGPDGKPLTGGRLIGGPKSLAELPTMPPDAIQEMATQAEKLLSQGTPLEVPVAMPQAILFGMIKTLQQGQEDRKLLEWALSTLRYHLHESGVGLEERRIELSRMAEVLRDYLGVPATLGDSAE